MIFSLSKRKRGKKQVLVSKKRTSFCILLYTRKPAIVKLFFYCLCVCVCVFFFSTCDFLVFHGSQRSRMSCGCLIFRFRYAPPHFVFHFVYFIGKKMDEKNLTNPYNARNGVFLDFIGYCVCQHHNLYTSSERVISTYQILYPQKYSK